MLSALSHKAYLYRFLFVCFLFFLSLGVFSLFLLDICCCLFCGCGLVFLVGVVCGFLLGFFCFCCCFLFFILLLFFVLFFACCFKKKKIVCVCFEALIIITCHFQM